MPKLDNSSIEAEFVSRQPDHTRMDVEWQLLCLIREMLGIALKGKREPTYAEALDLGAGLIPEWLSAETRTLAKNLESLLTRTFKQRADLTSTRLNQEIDPAQIVSDELVELGRILQERGRKNLVRRRSRQLSRVLDELSGKSPYSEGVLILRDALSTDRGGRALNIFNDVQCRELEFEDHTLKIRVLHPGRLEAATGADLLYEHHSSISHRVRLVAIQYKIWSNRTLYASQLSNLEMQLQRMKSSFCDRALCENEASYSLSPRYRLPYCMAFLRPTDKLQNPDSKLISSGYHIPICAVERLWTTTASGHKKLEAKTFRREAMTHKSFEELFNCDILGSRWIEVSELDRLYEDLELTKGTDRIVLHVEEHLSASTKRTKP